MRACAEPRPGHPESWINDPILDLYGELFAELNDVGSTVIMATHDEFVLSRYSARAYWLDPKKQDQEQARGVAS